MPSGSPSHLGLAFAVDSNFIDDGSDAAEVLRRYRDDGWIDLVRADTVETELGAARDGMRDALVPGPRSYPRIVASLGGVTLDGIGVSIARRRTPRGSTGSSPFSNQELIALPDAVSTSAT